MNRKSLKTALLILAVYLVATLSLLFLGYSVRMPAVARQEFPFTVTYSCQGEIKTISGVYVGEYIRSPKYLEDQSVYWNGYIKDHNRLESDFYRVAELDGAAFFINLNIEPGYLMGDPAYAGAVCQPSGACLGFDGANEIAVRDPGELERMGFSIVNWEYPEPIENTFRFGGLSLSSEASVYTAILAAAALLACLILVKKDREMVRSKMDTASIVLNFLIAFTAFPFILMTSVLSEILADTSVWQQLLYLSPALTILGIGTSVTARRLGCRRIGFWSQFTGIVIFALLVIFVDP